MTSLRIISGLLLTAALIIIAGVRAYSENLGPLVQEHGTTYYNGEGPVPQPIVCKREQDITEAMAEVHAKFDYLTGPDLKAFEQRALSLEGLPPLNLDKLYVITADDGMREGERVLFIGLRVECVSQVFAFPASLYHQIAGKSDSA